MGEQPWILVTGAGPTGLFFAHEMIKQGHRVRIIDRKAHTSLESKALGIHARTLEILDQAGIVDPFIKQGRHGKGLNLHLPNNKHPKLEFLSLSTPYPFVLCISQKWSEQILYDALRAVGGNVEWETELTSVHQGNCTLKKKDGSQEVVKPDWIIGSDGSRSVVRESMGIPFLGKGIARTFALIDVRGDISLDPYYIHSFFNTNEPFAILPFPPNQYRIMFATEPGMQEKKESYTIPFIHDMIQRRCGCSIGTIKAIDWVSFFNIKTCLADQMHQGNCFIMGDAAHVHSPLGAQGMNMSLQDAFNLAWKLNLVIKKVASPVLLESYNLERRSVIQKILKGTEKSTEIGFTLPYWTRAVIFRLLGLVTLFPKVRNKMTYLTSQLGVNYMESPIVWQPLTDTHWHAPQPGERAPYVHLVDGRSLFTLFKTQRHIVLLFQANAAVTTCVAKFAPWVDLHVIEGAEAKSAFLAEPQSIFVIRPDGYIGYRSKMGSVEELETFFAQTFNAIVPASLRI